MTIKLILGACLMLAACGGGSPAVNDPAGNTATTPEPGPDPAADPPALDEDGNCCCWIASESEAHGTEPGGESTRDLRAPDSCADADGECVALDDCGG